jgi:hypothetical protein
MSERLSRRTVISTALTARATGQHPGHPHDGGQREVKPQVFLTPHEFATLRVLCDVILPADDVSPAASATGTPEYIDTLCRGNVRIASIYHGGLAWLDSMCVKLFERTFLEARDGQRVEILQKIADPERTPSGWNAGVQFFDLVRKMTLDGYYTSPAGYRDVGYPGGKGMTTYEVPEAALRQAIERWKT